MKQTVVIISNVTFFTAVRLTLSTQPFPQHSLVTLHSFNHIKEESELEIWLRGSLLKGAGESTDRMVHSIFCTILRLCHPMF